MAVRIYEDTKTGEVVVWTSCLDTPTFILELASALAECEKTAGDRELRLSQALTRAMPIAFKLSGYKADEVSEQRTLSCGSVSPEYCSVVGRGGRE